MSRVGWGRVGSSAIRHVKAFILSVLAIAFLASFGICLLILSWGGEGPPDWVSSFMIFGIWGSLATFVLAAAIGIPLTLLCVLFRLERLWVYPSCGFVAGAVVMGMLARQIGFISRMDVIALGVIGAMAGALGGWLWWKLAREPAQSEGNRIG